MTKKVIPASSRKPAVKKTLPAKPGKRLIFRPWRKGPNGTILYAANYGLRAWPIEVSD